MPHPEPSPARRRTTGTAVEAVHGRAADALGAGWIQDHLDAVYRYARRRLSTPDAEDVAQQAFEALFRAQAAGRTPQDPGAYLFGTARRRVADLLRSRARRPAPVALPEDWAALGERTLPDEVLAGTEMRELVRVALGLLPGPDALVLRRRYRAGASIADIATSLGVTDKAVEMRLRRARAAFLEHFQRVGRDWLGEDESPSRDESLGRDDAHGEARQ